MLAADKTHTPRSGPASRGSASLRGALRPSVCAAGAPGLPRLHSIRPSSLRDFPRQMPPDAAAHSARGKKRDGLGVRSRMRSRSLARSHNCTGDKLFSMPSARWVIPCGLILFGLDFPRRIDKDRASRSIGKRVSPRSSRKKTELRRSEPEPPPLRGPQPKSCAGDPNSSRCASPPEQSGGLVFFHRASAAWSASSPWLAWRAWPSSS